MQKNPLAFHNICPGPLKALVASRAVIHGHLWNGPGPDYIVFLVKWVRLAGVPRPTQPGDINTLSPQRPQAEVSFENNSRA